MKPYKYLFLLLFFSINLTSYAESIYEEIGFRNYCYDSSIKTARLFKKGNENADPIIKLYTNETLVLIFDDLSPDYRNFYYTITHCDADWNEDNLNYNDYMRGLPEAPILDFEFSVNTAIPYKNYHIELPNNDVALNISGNYLIKIYNSDNRKLVLQKGFSIVENKTTVTAVVQSTPLLNQQCLQQIDFKVSHPALMVADAFMDLKIRIEQNSARIPNSGNPIPAFTNPTETDYTRPDKNLFSGNNEFHAFDIRNLSFTGMGVNKIIIEKGIYHVLLNNDNLSNKRYIANKDNNGKYIIGADLTNYPNTQADYVDVLFTLVADIPFFNGRVFLIGEFTDWNLDDRYEMHYNPEQGQYEATQTLKQGYYNYKYIILDNDGMQDMKSIDGCFADTENIYNIYVYYKQPSERYDRLVGFQKISSRSTSRNY